MSPWTHWRSMLALFGLALLRPPGDLLAQAPAPQWIWTHPGDSLAGEQGWLRKEFHAPFAPSRAELIASGDDEVVVYLNGREMARSPDWRQPIRIEVTGWVREGTNTLAMQVRNATAGPAAVVAQLELRSPNGYGIFIGTDASWLGTREGRPGWSEPGAELAAGEWGKVVTLGRLGVAPWGDVFGLPQATPAESLTVLPGFTATLLKSAGPTEGSWICMTVDDKGRLIVSPEKQRYPIWRMTLGENGAVVRTEAIPAPVRGAMGLLHAHDSLYVNGLGPQGVGLYRLIDANKNDQFDPEEVHLLKNFVGDNEHGYHAVVLGPDNMVYVLNGNHTLVPDGLDPASPFRNYAEDLLLPRLWDPNGHARGVLAPGGYVLRTDPEGHSWTLLLGGFRNAYDLDFHPDGEMFTFDADMEWDVSCPWYRPNRINHAVSGADFGWRSGSGKWPSYYPDSLPTTLDLGLASPTGVKFGRGSHYPPRYRDAFFVADWNYGKIFAVHLEPRGSTYTGTFETFLSGRPLAVTDLEFGRDGAMYFIIGGWMLQSGLYRVAYTGPPVAEPVPAPAEVAAREEGARQRALRRSLERFHGREDPAAVATVWPYLGSADVWLRHAARVALESQPVTMWQRRALQEEKPDAALTALLALARVGSVSHESDILRRLLILAGAGLQEDQALAGTRVAALCLMRMGSPEPELAGELTQAILRALPSENRFLNRELASLLVALRAESAVPAVMGLLRAAAFPDDQMHYAYVLRTVASGWTMELRREYYGWLNRAERELEGGNSFLPYLRVIRQEATALLNEAQKADLAEVLSSPPAVPWVPEVVESRPLVREWSMEALEGLLGRVDAGRSFTSGKAAFQAAQCVACHRMGRIGGATGPELTGVGGRFGRRDLLRHILEPSLVISDRYQTFNFLLKDGEEVTGTIAAETDEALEVIVNPLLGERRTVTRSAIVSRHISALSAMPEGLLSVLHEEEILDLLAYLEADGRPGHPAFVSGP